MGFEEFVINIDLPRSPCRGCENRRVGCHNAGQCREYDLFRQIAGAKAAKRYCEKNIEDGRHEAVMQTKKYGGKRKCLKQK